MRALKQSLVALTAGICLVTATAVVAIDPPTAEEFLAAQKQYNATLIDSLVAEGTPRAMTLAASAISYGREGYESNVEMQRTLLARATALAPNDAWVQWIAAVYLPRSKIVSEPALALQRIEPGNGAIWMFQLAAASEARDEKGITEALVRIGAAHSFDDHFGDAMVEWLRVVRTYPMPQTGNDASAQASSQMPLIMAVNRAAATSSVSYAIATRACESTSQPLAIDRREACLAAGRLMLKESAGLISMRVGASLLRLAHAEDATEVTRNADYFMNEASELSRSAMFDSAELERYQADWLQSRSEVQAITNQLKRAGVPLLAPNDWNEDPYGNLAKIARQKDG